MLGTSGCLDATLRAGAPTASLGLLEGVDQLGVSELQAIDHLAIQLDAPRRLLGFPQRLACVFEPGAGRLHGFRVRADLGDGGDVVTEGGDPVGERCGFRGDLLVAGARRSSKALDTSWTCVGSTGARPLSSSPWRVWTRARRLAGSSAAAGCALAVGASGSALSLGALSLGALPLDTPAARAAFTSALDPRQLRMRGFGFGDRVGIESRAGVVEPCGQLRAEALGLLVARANLEGGGFDLGSPRVGALRLTNALGLLVTQVASPLIDLIELRLELGDHLWALGRAGLRTVGVPTGALQRLDGGVAREPEAPLVLRRRRPALVDRSEGPLGRDPLTDVRIADAGQVGRGDDRT